MVWRLLCIMQLVGAFACPASQPQPSRRITVEITVARDDQKPIPGVTMGNASARVWGKSDAEGRMSLLMDVSAVCREVFVQVGCPVGTAPLPLEERRAQREQFKELCAHRSFRSGYEVRLRPEEPTYRLTVVAPLGMTLTGRLETAEGRPVGGTAMLRDVANGFAIVPEDGRFSLGGVQRGAPFEIYFTSPSQRGLVSVRRFEALADSGELGDIRLPEVSPDSTVSVRWEHWSEFIRPHQPLMIAGVTLIRTDGAQIWMLLHHNDGQGGTNEGEPVPIPAGSYYVVPGFFGDDPLQRKVLDAACAHADAVLAGLDVISVAKGEAKSGTYDAVRLSEAIRDLPGK
jgi:hypothetical protein